MADIKILGKVFNGVSKLNVQNASGGGTTEFSAGGGGGIQTGIEGNFTIPAVDPENPNYIYNLIPGYDGDGFIIGIFIWADGGAYPKDDTPWKILKLKNGIGAVSALKNDTENAPSYTSSSERESYYLLTLEYESGTDNFAVSNSASDYAMCNTGNPTGQGLTQVIRFNSANSIKLYLQNGTKYGFATGIKYNYAIVYSS